MNDNLNPHAAPRLSLHLHHHPAACVDGRAVAINRRHAWVLLVQLALALFNVNEFVYVD